MKARDIMTSNPVCVTPETSVREAARLMEQNDCGSLPVVESNGNDRLIGVVTDRDLALRILGQGRSADAKVSEAMTKNVHSVRPDANLDDVEQVMSSEQVRRVPVCDERGNVLGVIAQADLARELRKVGKKDFAEVVENISEPAGARR